MSLSLNEVEATAKKAARGAGYPWGLAEEAATAVRWLCANDLDGCVALAELLQRFDKTPVAEAAPNVAGEVWLAKGGTLCALATGAALSDRAQELASRSVRAGRLAAPGLLLPFAAFAARQIGGTISVEWQGGSAATDGNRLSVKGQPGALAEGVTIRSGGSLGPLTRHCTRAEPDRNALAILNRFAHRTYAPATEESRRRGAGADATDND